MTRHLVGVDVGGTFTDFVAFDESGGTVAVWKNLSTPHNPTDGVLEGLSRMPDTASVSHMRLGTTVATNTILERKGAVVGYLTTRGFRDVPFIQRGNRKAHYDITWVKPDPLVKRRHCLEVDERIDRDAQVVEPLDEAQVRALARELAEAGEVEAVAVNLLFSFLAPDHERRIRDILASELPDVPVSISYDVLPRWKEYERASTTIADAYLRPGIGAYIDQMAERLGAEGLDDKVVVIKSNGGEMTLAGAAAAPIHLAVSGPSGGVIGARHLAELLDLPNLVTFDMGGTSTDCSTLVDGAENFTTDFEVEWGLPIQIPMIDIRTIGAGGGSIAWIDKGGMLRVGPESAGADPGPACYGHGGDATVTDANVVLGRINPDNFLGGAMALDVEAARNAVAGIAGQIGKSAEETALAIVRIANNSMVGALRAVLIERGLDPREFTLLAFGGAGPLHCCDLMVDANVPRGLVPNHPGQFSAYGFIMTDARVDRHRTVQLSSLDFDPAAASDAMQELVQTAIADLAGQGYTDNIRVARSMEMRYFGQNYELELPLAPDRFDESTTAALWQSFHDLHLAKFGFNVPNNIIEVVNFMVTAVSVSDKPEPPTLAEATAPAEPTAHRPVVFDDGHFETPVYVRAELRAGHRIDGPAVVEEPASVTVVRPDQRVTVDVYGNLLIETLS